MPKYVDKEFGNHSRKVLNNLREYRRAQIQDMYMVKRMREVDISRALSISQSTVSLEINAIKSAAKSQLQAWLSEHLPTAFAISLQGLDAIILEIWRLYTDNSLDLKISEKSDLLSLLLHSYDKRLDMCGNADLIAEAMNQMEGVKNQLLSLHPES